MLDVLHVMCLEIEEEDQLATPSSNLGGKTRTIITERHC